MSVRKFQKNKGYESISRDFLQRNDLSLEARGLLAYMQSMPDNYVFHKTQLYQCFEKNRKTSVERIWNELLDTNFIIAFQKRIGKKNEYEYLFTHEGFEQEDIDELVELYGQKGWGLAYRSGTNRKSNSYYDEPKDDGEISTFSGVGNQQSKINTSKPTDIKLKSKRFTKKEDEEDIEKKAISVISDFENEKQNVKEIVEAEEMSLYEKYGNMASSLIKSAEAFTKEHLRDMRRYWDYLLVALRNEEQKYQEFVLVPQQETIANSFYIPMDGPWNEGGLN